MRSQLKRLIERTIVRSGVMPALRVRQRGGTLVLAYHNVVPEGHSPIGDRSLHIPQREFARQLDAMTVTHDVVPLTSLADDPPAGARPRLVITFDDAYEGALSAGVSELAQRGLPATVFVAPGLLGQVPWWDVIASPAEGGVPADRRRYALDVLRGNRESVIEWAESRGMILPDAATKFGIGLEEQLRDAVRHKGITLGSHTWSHPNLRALRQDELAGELSRPLQWLRERFDCVIPWLTYPYGLYSESVEGAAAESGYLGAFRVDGGWFPPRSDRRPFALPRLNIPSGMTLEGFSIRLAGIAADR